ncbi:MAG TPA: hypothetical protein DD719_03435 [Desulfotomaculum sp.]|nr:hypothetical protein [Desulfotomaculum sp.]HCJ79319.1 hypothetical protein [Desulfotomaculum sp.]
MHRSRIIEHDFRRYISLLIEKLEKDQAITAIFLFGSYAQGKQTRLSDIDLAILLEPDYPQEDFFKKKLELLPVITSILRTDEVDLIILNCAPYSLAYRVLGQGKLLYEKEERRSHRVNFQAQVYVGYFDFQPVEKVIHQGLRQRIKEGRFGG